MSDIEYSVITSDVIKSSDCIKFGKILLICSQDIERKGNLDINQGHNSGTNVRKMMCKNPNLDVVNINAYTNFG